MLISLFLYLNNVLGIGCCHKFPLELERIHCSFYKKEIVVKNWVSLTFLPWSLYYENTLLIYFGSVSCRCFIYVFLGCLSEVRLIGISFNWIVLGDLGIKRSFWAIIGKKISKVMPSFSLYFGLWPGFCSSFRFIYCERLMDFVERSGCISGAFEYVFSNELSIYFLQFLVRSSGQGSLWIDLSFLF